MISKARLQELKSAANSILKGCSCNCQTCKICIDFQTQQAKITPEAVLALIAEIETLNSKSRSEIRSRSQNDMVYRHPTIISKPAPKDPTRPMPPQC